jgi:acyl-CoA thioesterase-1
MQTDFYGKRTVMETLRRILHNLHCETLLLVRRRTYALRAALLLVVSLFTPVAYSASKTILVLGDSLSAEYGLTRGSGWVPLLQNRLKSEGIDAAIVNASISGETTSGGKSRVQALLDKHKPDIMVLELGANDALRGLPLTSTEANLRAMIAAAQKARARILLVGMRIPPNYGGDYTKRFTDIYPRLAKEAKAPLVPFLLERLTDKPQLFQSDRIHPTAEAQPLMLDTVWPHLKPMLK